MKRSVMWQRLETIGLEYAEIELNPLRLDGEVVLRDAGSMWALSYCVDCDSAGITTRALVRVRRDGHGIERVLSRSPSGEWTLDGDAAPQLSGLADVDLSITPATNTLPIRRLRLPVGGYAEVSAAWLRFPELDVVPLRQSYQRIGPTTYEYLAPQYSYRATIECDGDGIVRDYSGLWRLVA